MGRAGPRFQPPTRAHGRSAGCRRACARGRVAGTRMRAVRPRDRAGRAAGRGSASARPRPGRGGCARRSLPRRPGADARFPRGTARARQRRESRPPPKPYCVVMAWQVVIAGGGFGGFYAARALERLLPAQSAHVTLVNDANFMLYTPLLPGAAGATLDPRHVVVALRSQLRRTDLVIGSVTGADPAARTLAVKRIDGEQLELGYDQLIVALGSVSRTLPIPGLGEHAIGFKSLSDATALRNQVLSCLDVAESLEDPALRAEYLGFVFVGAGYAGVEGLAELQDFAAQAIEMYPRCAAQGMRWVLIEAKGRIMQEVPESLSEFAERELRRRGIEVRTGTTMRELSARAVTLADGETIAART